MSFQRRSRSLVVKTQKNCCWIGSMKAVSSTRTGSCVAGGGTAVSRRYASLLVYIYNADIVWLGDCQMVVGIVRSESRFHLRLVTVTDVSFSLVFVLFRYSLRFRESTALTLEVERKVSGLKEALSVC